MADHPRGRRPKIDPNDAPRDARMGWRSTFYDRSGVMRAALLRSLGQRPADRSLMHP